MRTYLAVCIAMLVGCAAPAADDAETGAESAFTSSEEAGIDKGSLGAEGVLIYANDHATTADAMTTAGLAPAFADALVAARKNADGTPKWFASLAEVEAVPGADAAAFAKMLTAAKAAGYVEAAGFDPPTSARLSIPDHLGRPPNSNDVTVEAGFDGKTPDEVVAMLRSRITNTIDPRNDRFTNDTIKANHKSFTIALGNFYSLGSPPSNFAWTLPGAKLTLLGTMSVITPVILMAEKNGVTTYYTRQTNGIYGAIPAPTYAIVMRARISLRPQGERIFYPAWSAKALSGPTSVIIESP